MESIRARVSFGSQEKCEKRLRQILCISGRVTAPPDKAVDWRPIHFAQLRERVCRLWHIRKRATRDDAPMRSGKVRSAFLERARRRFHAASITNDSSQRQLLLSWFPRIEL